MRRRAGPVRGHAGVEAAVLHPRRADVEVGYDVAVDGHVLPDQVPEKAGGKSYFAFGQQSVHPPSMGRESDGSGKAVYVAKPMIAPANSPSTSACTSPPSPI